MNLSDRITNHRYIEIIKGDEYRSKIGSEITDNLLFYDVYKRANQIVNEIINTTNHYSQQRSIDNMGFSYSLGNNIILFTGPRGQGKTSAMNTFSYFLKDRSILKTDEATNDCHKNGTFEVLGIIDPTTMNNKESLMRVLLSKMLISFERKAKEIDKLSCYKESGDRAQREELLRQFSLCYDNINFLESSNIDYLEMNDLDSLARLGYGTDLRSNFLELVCQYLSYMDSIEQKENDKPKRYLVIQIDDADLSAGNSFVICEQIREYLQIPGVIVLMAADFNQIRNSIYQEYISQYEKLIKLQTRIDVIDSLYQKTWKYLEKMFPEGHRVYIPDMKNLMRDSKEILHIRYLDENRKAIFKNSNDNNEDIQEQLLKAIYDRTGIIFSDRQIGVHPILPETMRELTHFLKYVIGMPKIDHVSLFKGLYTKDGNIKERKVKQLLQLRENLKRFYYYCFNNWMQFHIGKEVYNIIWEMSDAKENLELVYKKLTKKIELLKLGTEWHKEDYIMDEHSPIPTLEAIFLQCEALESQEEYHMLKDAASIYYSVYLNELFVNAILQKSASKLRKFVTSVINISAKEKEEIGLMFVLDHPITELDYLKSYSWYPLFVRPGRKDEESEYFDLWNFYLWQLDLIEDPERYQLMSEEVTGNFLFSFRNALMNPEVRGELIKSNRIKIISADSNENWYFRCITTYKALNQWAMGNNFKYLDLAKETETNEFEPLMLSNRALATLVYLSNSKNKSKFVLECADRIISRCQKICAKLKDYKKVGNVNGFNIGLLSNEYNGSSLPFGFIINEEKIKDEQLKELISWDQKYTANYSKTVRFLVKKNVPIIEFKVELSSLIEEFETITNEVGKLKN